MLGTCIAVHRVSVARLKQIFKAYPAVSAFFQSESNGRADHQ